MTNLAHRLITDLIDEDLVMLHNGDIAPRAISFFYDYEPNQEVRDATRRLEEAMCTMLDPDDVYHEPRRYCPWIPGTGVMLTPKVMIIVLHYTGASQRVLELRLEKDSASLHFHKK